MAEADKILSKRALVLLLFETGCRVGEVLSAPVSALEFDEYGAVLRVHGRTGGRRARIVFSAPILAEWLNNYACRKNPGTPFWNKSKAE